MLSIEFKYINIELLLFYFNVITTGSIAKEKQEGRGKNRKKSQEQKCNFHKSFNDSLTPAGKCGVSMAEQLSHAKFSVKEKRRHKKTNRNCTRYLSESKQCLES